MTNPAAQPRKTTAGSAGQFDFVHHQEPEASLSPAAARVLSDDELMRRDREVSELHLADGETYKEYPASTLRAFYAEEAEKLHGWRESTEPRHTHDEMRPYWERKERELAYLTGATDNLV